MDDEQKGMLLALFPLVTFTSCATISPEIVRRNGHRITPAPDYLKYVNSDATLSIDQKLNRNSLVQSWDEQIKNSKKSEIKPGVNSKRGAAMPTGRYRRIPLTETLSPTPGRNTGSGHPRYGIPGGGTITPRHGLLATRESIRSTPGRGLVCSATG